MLKVIPITTRYYETLNTTRSILDKRVRVEISALQEMCEKNDLVIHWLKNLNKRIVFEKKKKKKKKKKKNFKLKKKKN